MPVEDEHAADGVSLLEEGRFMQQTIVAHLLRAFEQWPTPPPRPPGTAPGCPG